MLNKIIEKIGLNKKERSMKLYEQKIEEATALRIRLLEEILGRPTNDSEREECRMTTLKYDSDYFRKLCNI